MFGFGGMGGGGMMGMPNQMGLGQQHHPELTYIPDTAEKVNIAPLALVKMLKHCKWFALANSAVWEGRPVGDPL